MKRIITIALAIVLVLMMGATGVFAQQNENASAKATAKIADISILSESTGDPDDTGWVSVLSQTIKTANDKDLFIDVSLQCGLYTETNVKSQGSKDTSDADTEVWVKVMVDTDTAYPGAIVFNSRYQKLSALLQGIINTETGVVTDPEEIELLLDTMTACSFNFIVEDLDAGMHTVTVKAKCATDASSMAGSAKAKASIGYGSVTVEEVRMVKGEDAVPEL
jgi:hypothetical protein